MKNLIRSLAFAALFAFAGDAAAVLRVVTTIPDLADITREIGGKLVDVESIATGVEDPHAVPVKPSHVTKLNRADAVICIGLDNEHAYLPALLEAGRNPRILPGKTGYIDTSRGIAPLEVPKTLSKSEGDVHPAGNPHYNLDPVLGRTIVRNICDGLCRCDAKNESAYCAGRDAYLAKLDAKIAEWQKLAAPLKGVKFVSYHNHWAYFSERYGMTYEGTIELRHGVEPTAKHIIDLIAQMKADQVKIVVREPQFAEKTPNHVAAQTGAKVVKLAIMVGGVPEAKTYLDLIDYNVRTLLKAVQN
ncbi:MAG: metal ABC transporter substrate-binding protein [Limisphaerales bacterium]